MWQQAYSLLGVGSVGTQQEVYSLLPALMLLCNFILQPLILPQSLHHISRLQADVSQLRGGEGGWGGGGGGVGLYEGCVWGMIGEGSASTVGAMTVC